MKCRIIAGDFKLRLDRASDAPTMPTNHIMNRASCREIKEPPAALRRWRRRHSRRIENLPLTNRWHSSFLRTGPPNHHIPIFLAATFLLSKPRREPWHSMHIDETRHFRIPSYDRSISNQDYLSPHNCKPETAARSRHGDRRVGAMKQRLDFITRRNLERM